MRQARGFTLLEVLLAVAIAIILTATMAGTIGIGFRLKKEAEFAVESVHGIETGGDVWVKEVRCALPPNPNSSVDPNAIGGGAAGSTGTTGTTSAASGGVSTGIPLFLMGAFYGDAQTLQFYNTGPEPKADLQSDIKYVEFGLEQVNGTNAFVRRVNTNLLGPDSLTDIRSNLTEQVLITGVTSLQFQYYDENNNILAQWDSTSTDTPSALPYAVEMLITLPGFRPGDPDRVIHRFAYLTCAAPIQDQTGIVGTPGLSGF